MSYQPENEVPKKPRKARAEYRKARRDFLTDPKMKALKPTAGRDQDVVWDEHTSGLCVRISEKRKQKVFYAVKRRIKGENPVWHKLGVYPALSLAQARIEATEAVTALEKGEHPKAIVEAKRRAAIEAERETFRAVAERYLRHLARAKTPARASTLRMYNGYLNNWLYPELGDRPITTVTRKQVINTLELVRERSGVASLIGAKSLVSAILNWAADLSILPVNPAAGINTKSLTGRLSQRAQVMLSDPEVAAVWSALPAVGGPFETVYRLLLLTGLRLNEVAGLKWEEIDLDKGELNLPAERCKNGLPMVVPLPPLAVEILREVKRFDGPHVFTTTFGRRPVSASSHAKARLDAAIKAAGVTMPDFVVHDFRRVVRTGLTALGVTRDVAEAVLNHKKPGLVDTYDKHEYLPEKRAALAAWETRLRGVVGLAPPPAGNVLPLRGSA